MENLSKALLIAAGMLFTVMILSMLMITYNQVASHYQQQHELAVIDQTELFNKEFENYNRAYIRGNDLISLMNKIIDYNTSQSYREDIGSKRILVTIELPDNDVITRDFMWRESDRKIIDDDNDGLITNTGAADNYTGDQELIEITGTGSLLIGTVYDKFGITITETELQKLSADIFNIVLEVSEDVNEEEDLDQYSKRFKRATLLKYILGLKVGTTESDAGEEFDIIIDNESGITEPGYEDEIDTIKKIACEYYQYTQFKRACFECTEVKYDVDTKRIVEMNFAMQTVEDEEGNKNVIFD